jgi:hypothetical protein
LIWQLNHSFAKTFRQEMENDRRGAGAIQQSLAQLNQFLRRNFRFTHIEMHSLTAAIAMGAAIAERANLCGRSGQRHDFVGDYLHAVFANLKFSFNEYWIIRA